MSFWIDIQYSLRLLLKKPAFTLTSTLIVAIGLGLALYTYSLLGQLIFKPLKMNGEMPLIAIEGKWGDRHGFGNGADPYHLSQLSEESELLQGMSMYRASTRQIGGMSSEAGTRKFEVSDSQWNLFEVVGVQPTLGRGFNPRDSDSGAEPVIILSYDIWQNFFSGNENIIGTSIRVDAVPTQIIGVMPMGFSFPDTAEIWQPLAETRLKPETPSESRAGLLFSVGRLKQDVSMSQFRKEIDWILQKHYKALPQNLQWRADAPAGYIRAFDFKMTDNNVYHHLSVFVAMLIVVVLILLLTCINIGNLLLVRVNERIKEVAIRISLGIPRNRLVLQMLWESIFICTIGGIIAFFLGLWGMNVTNQVLDQIFANSGGKPFWWNLSLAPDGIGFLLLTILLMIFVTGFIPARRALSSDFNSVLRDGTRGALGKKVGRATKLLVITEVTLSCVVLIVATILLSSSHSAQEADYGVDTQNRITATLRLPSGTYPWTGEPESRTKIYSFYYKLKDKLESRPNIEGVAFFNNLPGQGEGSVYYEVEGRAAPVYNQNNVCNNEIVTRDSWRAIGMKLIEGRDFNVGDINSPANPIVINAAMARDHFPNGDAIGKRIRSVGAHYQRPWRTIIGVVSDSIHGSVMHATSAKYTAYDLMDWQAWTRMEMAMHYSGSKTDATSTLREAINNIDADVAAYNVQSYDDLIKTPMLLVDAVNKIFLWCGIVALFLAATGIYSVSANSIALRTQEIATRRALGATHNNIITMFLKESGMQLCIGLALGLGLSFWLISQITKSMIIDTQSYLTGLIGIPAFITILVLAATYWPITKILKKEPIDGLRHT